MCQEQYNTNKRNFKQLTYKDIVKIEILYNEEHLRKEIIKLIPNKTAESVVKALNRIERHLGVIKFRKIFKTITTDNGAEFRNWKLIEKSYTGSNIARTSQYYADAYYSWQRGANENINKMIRRFFLPFSFFYVIILIRVVIFGSDIRGLPKGTDFFELSMMTRNIKEENSQWPTKSGKVTKANTNRGPPHPSPRALSRSPLPK